MGKKAVYVKQHLAIYITREDFEFLLKVRSMLVPVFIGKHKTSLGDIYISLNPPVINGLEYALEAERQAIREVQDQFAREHPNYTSSTDTQRRQQRARKRLRRRSNDPN